MKSHVLLESCLKELKLPTILREYGRAARQCAQEDRGYEAFLQHLAELEVAEAAAGAAGELAEEAVGEAVVAGAELGVAATLDEVAGALAEEAEE